jgi:predicted unusual protein kinase regulating ubiquinone biosynthesis (AarF/ABC1/UbiB family)
MNEAIQGNYEGLTIACQNIQKIAELLKEWPDKTLSWILVQDANYIGSLHYDLFKLHRDKSLLGTPQYEMSVRKIKTTIVHLEQIKEQIDPPVNLVNESSPLLQSTQRKMMYSQE